MGLVRDIESKFPKTRWRLTLGSIVTLKKSQLLGGGRWFYFYGAEPRAGFPQMVPLFFTFFYCIRFNRRKKNTKMERRNMVIYHGWCCYVCWSRYFFFLFLWLYSILSRGWASRLQIDGTSLIYSSFIPWFLKRTLKFITWFDNFDCQGLMRIDITIPWSYLSCDESGLMAVLLYIAKTVFIISWLKMDSVIFSMNIMELTLN